MTEASIAVVKMLFLWALSFSVAMAVTPLLTHYLYKYKCGKNVRSDSSTTPVVAALHKHKSGTPTMGGILIWGTTLVLAVVFNVLPDLFPTVVPHVLNFVTRSETLLHGAFATLR